MPKRHIGQQIGEKNLVATGLAPHSQAESLQTAQLRAFWHKKHNCTQTPLISPTFITAAPKLTYSCCNDAQPAPQGALAFSCAEYGKGTAKKISTKGKVMCSTPAAPAAMRLMFEA